ncbi:hypothetical protein ACFFQF_06340 [Haladaptatus pallidirubidus]|uniref:Bifunctional DNA primase/polymerase, N-terminal n=1 Tax=Haladaptatus pallidirubidus TaxID=1008152 RepID=A0AAV3UM43_9EURY|nr:hypothetical protein [Haladaptatus pallidirubidus]
MSISTSTLVSHVEAGNLKQQFIELLRDAGIPTNRCVRVGSDSKGAYDTGWNQTTNQREPEEISGNYGVTAGNGLLNIDIDDYGGSPSVPDDIQAFFDKHPTTGGTTPHGGGRLFYGVPVGTEERFREAFNNRSKITIDPVEVEWATTQQVVAPGSELTGCSKDWHDCGEAGEGRYSLIIPTPICRLAEDDVDGLIELIEKYDNSPEPVENVEIETRELNVDEQDWLDKGREMDGKFDRLCTFAEKGGYPRDHDLEFGKDRSKAETALAQKLMWIFGSFPNPEDTVQQVMNQLSPPRWSTSGDFYRDSVLTAAMKYTLDIGECYKGGQNDKSTRGVVQKQAAFIIWVADKAFDDKFRTKEIVNHGLVGVKRDQVVKVLRDLEKVGILKHQRQGQYEYWIKQTDIPTSGSIHEMFLENYITEGELKKQRADYLSKMEEEEVQYTSTTVI